MNLRSKIQSVAANPVMLSAYARWIGSKLMSGKPPRLPLPGGASIGEWLSFSEYWSFQDIVPKPERLFIERCLSGKQEGSGTAIDIGANLGAFACLIASMDCTVHAFEPIPETFCRLKNNVTFNGLLDRTRLNCLAVGKEQGSVMFSLEKDSPATNQMALPGHTSSSTAANVQTVAAVSLDGYCAAQRIEFIDFLKVDVEGMEPLVLHGANKLFSGRKIAAALIEICPVNLRAVGLSPAALYHEFEVVRYLPYVLNDDGKPGSKLSLAEIEAMGLTNVVLLPDS